MSFVWRKVVMEITKRQNKKSRWPQQESIKRLIGELGEKPFWIWLKWGKLLLGTLKLGPWLDATQASGAWKMLGIENTRAWIHLTAVLVSDQEEALSRSVTLALVLMYFHFSVITTPPWIICTSRDYPSRKGLSQVNGVVRRSKIHVLSLLMLILLWRRSVTSAITVPNFKSLDSL